MYVFCYCLYNVLLGPLICWWNKNLVWILSLSSFDRLTYMYIYIHSFNISSMQVCINKVMLCGLCGWYYGCFSPPALQIPAVGTLQLVALYFSSPVRLSTVYLIICKGTTNIHYPSTYICCMHNTLSFSHQKKKKNNTLSLEKLFINHRNFTFSY